MSAKGENYLKTVSKLFSEVILFQLMEELFENTSVYEGHSESSENELITWKLEEIMPIKYTFLQSSV